MPDKGQVVVQPSTLSGTQFSVLGGAPVNKPTELPKGAALRFTILEEDLHRLPEADDQFWAKFQKLPVGEIVLHNNKHFQHFFSILKKLDLTLTLLQITSFQFFYPDLQSLAQLSTDKVLKIELNTNFDNQSCLELLTALPRTQIVCKGKLVKLENSQETAKRGELKSKPIKKKARPVSQ